MASVCAADESALAVTLRLSVAPCRIVASSSSSEPPRDTSPTFTANGAPSATRTSTVAGGGARGSLLSVRASRSRNGNGAPGLS